MNPAPRGTVHHRARPPRRTGLVLLRWGLLHPLRLLQRYGFGWLQFGLLVIPVLLTFSLIVGPSGLDDLASLLRP